MFFLKEVIIWPFFTYFLLNRFDKKIRYASRKARADVRKRVKGRFVKAGEAYDYDPLSQTRSY
jgi:hypothetical protein